LVAEVGFEPTTFGL